MATTVSKIKNLVNDYIGDSTTNSVTDAERYRAISYAVIEATNAVGLDVTKRTLDINFYDGIYYYDISSDAPDMLEATNVYLEKQGERLEQFTKKSPREIRVDIDNGEQIPSYGTDTYNQKTYLIINYDSQYGISTINECDSLTSNGTWAADTTNSDATNLVVDTNEYVYGSGSLSFDIDVSQSGNNRATISNSGLSQIDASTFDDIGSVIFEAYIPDNTYITSYTIYWGSDSSNYWSATATTDAYGASFQNGWNTVKVDWVDATEVSSPDSSAIDYIRIDMNYDASQGDDTNFRIDRIRFVRPEKMVLEYHSDYVGKNNSGTWLSLFTADTDVPIYSGLHDGLDIYVAHKSAATLFRKMGLAEDASTEDALAERELARIYNRFPTSSVKPQKGFKPKGLNFNK